MHDVRTWDQQLNEPDARSVPGCMVRAPSPKPKNITSEPVHLLSLNLQASHVWPENDTVVRQHEHSVAEPRRIEHEDCGCERPFLAVLALESLVVQRACRDEPRDEEDDHEDAPSMVRGDADLLFVDGRRGCRKHRKCDNHRRLEVVAERDELHEMPTPVGQRVVTMKVPVCTRGGELRYQASEKRW